VQKDMGQKLAGLLKSWIPWTQLLQQVHPQGQWLLVMMSR
jgi:hypothetical protein